MFLLHLLCDPMKKDDIGQVLKNGPSKICGRQPLKNLKYLFKFFKGCLPQILHGPILNTLSHINPFHVPGFFSYPWFSYQG